MRSEELTHDYIRGLINGQGCFTFHTVPNRLLGGVVKKVRIPAFILTTHDGEDDSMTAIRKCLNIEKEPYRTSRSVFKLVIRDLGTLKNIIIPVCYNRLIGYKKQQFETWLNKMGTDPDVPDQYKLLYRLYKRGYFDQNPKF